MYVEEKETSQAWREGKRDVVTASKSEIAFHWRKSNFVGPASLKFP